jgi:GntR family transcriptional regulator/MocR family aminotransferase
MRLEYARRRAALVDALAGVTCPGTHARAAGHAGAVDAPPEPGTFRLLGDTAGMHLVLELPASFPAGRLVAAAAERGVGLHTVDRYFAAQPTLSGLILGYGAAPLTQVRRAAGELGPLLSRLLLGRNRQRVGHRQRGWQVPRVDLEHVRSCQPVRVDPAGPDVDAAGHL